jgi:hypothetical protein
MAKRGRPRKNGAKHARILERSMVALHGYDQARRAGEKHSAAVTAGTEAVRKQLPKMPMSETEMRRVLAHHWGNKQGVILAPLQDRVLDSAETERYILMQEHAQKMIAQWEGREWEPQPRPSEVRALCVGFAPRPQYPRINGKRPPQ